MDLICSFTAAGKVLGLLPQPHCPWVSTVVLFACLHEGRPLGFSSWGCPGGLGFAPVRARCGGGTAAWVAGVLAAPGTQRGWRLGQQEIQCSRRVWQPISANMLQYSCLENPLTEKPGRPQSVAAAGKSLQSCPTLCNPLDGSPPGSPVPGVLQARTLEWVAISFSNA